MTEVIVGISMSLDGFVTGDSAGTAGGQATRPKSDCWAQGSAA